MFTDYNLKPGSCDVLYVYAKVDKPDTIHIYTQH
jgi:hypothetical protein